MDHSALARGMVSRRLPGTHGRSDERYRFRHAAGNNGADNLGTMAVVEAGYQSIRERRSVEISEVVANHEKRSVT